MATALSLINRALRLIKVKQLGQTLPAEEANDALAVLNSVLAEMYESDIRLPDYAIATPQTDLTLDAADFEAMAYLLGQRLWPEYKQGPMPPAFDDAGSQAMSRLRHRYFQPGTVDFRELPGSHQPFDINNG